MKGQLSRLVGGNGGAAAALERFEGAPQAWEPALREELSTDPEIVPTPEVVAAAQELLALTDPVGSAAGKYTVTVSGGRGVQVGDHNVQHNDFRSSTG